MSKVFFKKFKKNDVDVALIHGGLSSYETDVSLMTMKRVREVFDDAGIHYHLVEVDARIVKKLKNLKPKRSFLAVHGLFGEDGGLQSLLEVLNIPYTGSGVTSSALCMDKIFFKKWMKAHNILTPSFEVLERVKNRFQMTSSSGEISIPPFLPCVIKPCSLGSSIGVSICRSQKDWDEALKNVFNLGQRVLVEEYIQGKEIAVPWFDSKSLTPIEIVPSSDFYDFNSKYVSGDTQYFVPARVDSSILEESKKITEQVARISQIGFYGRADFIVKKEKIYLIEMNTLPGLTEHSLVPKSALHEGISYSDLILKILDSAQ